MMNRGGDNTDWKAMYMGVLQGEIEHIIIPEGVTRLKNYALYGFTDAATKMTKVTLPSTLNTIGQNVFNSCVYLADITIPASVTSIGGNAFIWCSGLQYVVLEPTTPPTLGNNTVFNNTNNCPIYVPDASVATYKAANRWSDLASRIFPISDMPTT